MKNEGKLAAYAIAYSFMPLLVLITAFDVDFWEAVGICLFISFAMWSYQTLYQFGLVWLDKGDNNFPALVADLIKQQYPAPTHYEETMSDWLQSLSQNEDVPAAQRVVAASMCAIENHTANQLKWPVRLWHRNLRKSRLASIKREYKNQGHTIF